MTFRNMCVVVIIFSLKPFIKLESHSLCFENRSSVYITLKPKLVNPIESHLNDGKIEWRRSILNTLTE